MRVGILTHPLINNYGGILQAYALQTYLQSLGCSVLIIDYRKNRNIVKRVAFFILSNIPFTPYGKFRHRINKLTKFIHMYIHRTKVIYSDKKLDKLCKKNDLDSIIVGSDQVWRADFASRYGGLYFLNFIPKDSKIRKIAYAASLGHDSWQYTPKMTVDIQKWLLDFRAISVREDSAVKLCKQYLNVDAKHVLDPTLLLTHSTYDKLITHRLVPNKYIFVYWLGNRSRINKILSPFMSEGYVIIEQYLRSNTTQISIEDWLSYIKYADRVITDSFHGCVFSIIFQRQFSVYPNDSGGNTRLQSLFKMLNIEDITDKEQFYLDYGKVHNRLKDLQLSSQHYLKIALSI